MMLEALDRDRGKGQQKVTVEHVHVQSGGQAVVGIVERSGGSEKNGGTTRCADCPIAGRCIRARGAAREPGTGHRANHPR